MILDEKIEIILSSSNLNHFILLGYDNIKCGNKLNVLVKELLPSCKKRVKVRCDICEIEKEINYFSYYRNIKKYNFYSSVK